MSIDRPSSIDRRRFLEIGAAASLTAALPQAPAAAAPAVANGPQRARSPEVAGLKPHAVIYDERFEVARRFAVSVRSARVPVHPMRGDVTQLWYAWLYPLWKRAPAPIAGLTAYAAMFCLERLAWDQHLRMVRCAAGEAAYGSAGWPMERAAAIARGIQASSLASSRHGAAADARVAAESGPGSGPLHFWLIASPAQLATLGA